LLCFLVSYYRLKWMEIYLSTWTELSLNPQVGCCPYGRLCLATIQNSLFIIDFNLNWDIQCTLGKLMFLSHSHTAEKTELKNIQLVIHDMIDIFIFSKSKIYFHIIRATAKKNKKKSIGRRKCDNKKTSEV
jgi:hypothetical protein